MSHGSDMNPEPLAVKDGLRDEKEEAKRLRVCTRTLINWRGKNLVPFYKIGRRILYRSSDVDKVLDERYRRGAA